GVGCLMGALLLTRPALALTLRLARRPLARLGGPSGQLAWANLVRNPRRIAASSTALLIGVTLVATVLVAAATTRATLASEIDTRYPVDAEVLALRDPLPDGLDDVLAATPGVADVAVVPGTTVQIGGTSRPVLGIDEAARDTARGELAELTPGRLLLPPAVARNGGITDGELITLGSGAAAVELRAQLSSADLGSPLISTADLARLDPTPAAWAIWIRTAPGADAARVTEQIRAAVADADAAAVLNGAVRLREAYQSALDTAGLVALGLLAVSVAIAMVGITNTLTLSVLERGRESALLRALGLTRRRLRACLAWEALVLALTAAIGGIVLGSALGVAGSYALLEFGPRTVPELPIAQLAGVAVVATALAALASTLPAHVALRTPPARALTTE
ncbi:MAG: FtsX-like permease family protein, partial [Pseudonocardia sp.]|nr:FtsX-like permease family protein [Pseudonocardia sp.]